MHLSYEDINPPHLFSLSLITLAFSPSLSLSLIPYFGLYTTGKLLSNSDITDGGA